MAHLFCKVPDGTPFGLIIAVSLTQLCCCNTKTATDIVWKYVGVAQVVSQMAIVCKPSDRDRTMICVCGGILAKRKTHA